MIQKLTCSFPTSSTTYNIEIRQGLIHDTKSIIRSLELLQARPAIIADSTTADLYGRALQSALAPIFDAELFSFPAGERYKNRHTKEQLEDQLFERGYGRDTCIIGLGGGVTTDLAGYLAATFCRGVPLILIPTSLLAMVDASIGGKTAVNTPYGKNLVGAFHHPQKVIIDPSVLQTLPSRELKNGIVEMIKHGLIADLSYFEFLEQNAQKLIQLDLQTLEKAIFESCRIKKSIVEEDEKGTHKRHLVNFGHTVGHALEKLTNYSLSHGEAVALGIKIESLLSIQAGHFPIKSFQRIQSIFNQYNISLKYSHPFSPHEIFEAMYLDKKSIKGLPRFVILQDLGHPLEFGSAYCTHVDKEFLLKTIKEINI